MIILTGKTDSYAQFITVLLIFVAVLAVTALVTKYIQLVRIGESYFAIAVCKDTVTNLGEIPAGQLKDKTTTDNTSGFRELLKRAAKKENEEQDH